MMRSGRQSLWVLIVLAACLAAMAPASHAETVSLPNDAATGSSQFDELQANSCPAAGDCAAVGYYTDSSGHQQGLVETEIGGTWSAGEVNVASLGGATNPVVDLDAVDCASAGDCVAVGDFVDASGHRQGLIETEAGGIWSAAEASLSGIAIDSNPDVYLSSVSCPSVGDCVAVGNYSDSSGDQQALIETETDGTWSAATPSLSGLGANSNPKAGLNSVSCPSASDCVAVGYYEYASDYEQGLVETDTNGTWFTSNVNLANLDTYVNPEVDLQSVSCASPGDCTDVGYYWDSTQAWQGLLDSEQNGVWQPATEATLPANAATGSHPGRDLYLNSVSCASVGNCVAVGTYDSTSSDHVEGLILNQSSGIWSSGIQLALPSTVASNPDASLDSVSCVSSGICAAAGTYIDSGGSTQAIVARRTDRVWSTGNVEAASGAYDYASDGVAASCSPGGYCGVVGYTSNGASFFLNAPGDVAAPSASVQGALATVSWSAPADDGGLPVTDYNVIAQDLTDPTRGGQALSTASGNFTSVTFSGLTPGDSYAFTVTPENLLGDGLPTTSGFVLAAHATTAQLHATLTKLLVPKGVDARLKKLRHTDTYTFTYDPLGSGRIVIKWYDVTGRGEHKRNHLVASGSTRWVRVVPVKIKVRLTRFGRILIKSRREVTLTSNVTFTSGNIKITLKRTFTLR